LGFLFAGSAIEKTPNQREQAIEVGLRYAGRLHTREEIEALVDALSAPSEDAIGALLRMMERLGRYIAKKGWIEGKDSRAELLRIYLDRNLHRRITLSELTREGDVILYRVRANGFLYNMVRILTGTLLAVGEGKLTPADIPRITEARDRSLAGITMPPHGLYLNRVIYPEECLSLDWEGRP
jgi:hypothetical protein